VADIIVLLFQTPPQSDSAKKAVRKRGWGTIDNNSKTSSKRRRIIDSDSDDEMRSGCMNIFFCLDLCTTREKIYLLCAHSGKQHFGEYINVTDVTEQCCFCKVTSCLEKPEVSENLIAFSR